MTDKDIPGAEPHSDGERVRLWHDVEDGTEKAKVLTVEQAVELADQIHRAATEVDENRVLHQDVIEEVDDHLQDALRNANRYRSHEQVRPSAVMAFNSVQNARITLDQIDERDFTEGED